MTNARLQVENDGLIINKKTQKTKEIIDKKDEIRH